MELLPVRPTVKTPAQTFTDGGDPTTWLEPVTDEQCEQANNQD
ncbi:MAG TPA: hypothetical protein VGD29_21645 [Actinoplanes sp.]|jgi:hypothetical protein